MTFKEYKGTWLKEKICVDEYGRDLNLSDIPMTMMSRKDVYSKRKYTDKQINKIYSDWILENYMKHADI
jgi:hypothetical protein